MRGLGKIFCFILAKMRIRNLSLHFSSDSSSISIFRCYITFEGGEIFPKEYRRTSMTMVGDIEAASIAEGSKGLGTARWIFYSPSLSLFYYNPGLFSGRVRHLFSGKHTRSSRPEFHSRFSPQDKIQFSWMKRKHGDRER